MTIWQQILIAVIGIPVSLFLLYLVTRVVSVALLHSWWDTKMLYLKKLRKEQEGENGNG